MKKKIPILQAILPDSSVSNDVQLLDSLQQWDEEHGDEQRRKLLSNTAVRDAVAARIQQVSESLAAAIAEDSSDVQGQQLLEQLSLLDFLTRLVPTEPGHQLARHLLYGCNLLRALAAAIDSIVGLAGQHPDAASRLPDDFPAALARSGRAMLGAIQDMAAFTFPVTITSATQPGSDSQRARGEGTGRDACGAALLGPLLNLATLDERLNTHFYSLRRSAVAALRELVTCCRRNQLILLGATHSQAYNQLMGQVLPLCGDHPTQVDLFEMLYRCAKPFGEKAYHAYLDAQMRGLLAQLLAQDTADLELEAELCKLVDKYNIARGQQASVVSISAEHLKVSCPLLRPDGKHVALGDGHLSVSVLLDAPGPEEEDEQEVLDIDYANLARVISTMAITNNHPRLAGCHVVDMQCKAFPPCLGPNVAGAAEVLQGRLGGNRGAFSLALGLRDDQMVKLMTKLRDNGVVVVNVSSAVQEPSQQQQKPRKISMGTMPSSYHKHSYHKEPLPLSKTTPAPGLRPKPLALAKSTPRSLPGSDDSSPAPSNSGGGDTAAGAGKPARSKSKFSAVTPPASPKVATAAAGTMAHKATPAAAAASGADKPWPAAAAAGVKSVLAASTPKYLLHTVGYTGDGCTGTAPAAGDGAATNEPRTDSQLLAMLDNFANTAERLKTRSKGPCAGRVSLDSDEALPASQAARQGKISTAAVVVGGRGQQGQCWNDAQQQLDQQEGNQADLDCLSQEDGGVGFKQNKIASQSNHAAGSNLALHRASSNVLAAHSEDATADAAEEQQHEQNGTGINQWPQPKAPKGKEEMDSSAGAGAATASAADAEQAGKAPTAQHESAAGKPEEAAGKSGAAAKARRGAMKPPVAKRPPVGKGKKTVKGAGLPPPPKPPSRGRKAAASKAAAAAPAAPAEVTQDSIQDPDLPSLPHQAAATAGSHDAAMPAWMASPSAAPAVGPTGRNDNAAGAPANSSITYRRGGSEAGAADAAAADNSHAVAAQAPVCAGTAAAPAVGCRVSNKKTSRLTGMQATTPNRTGKPLLATPASSGAAATDAAICSKPNRAGARTAVSKAFPNANVAAAAPAKGKAGAAANSGTIVGQDPACESAGGFESILCGQPSFAGDSFEYNVPATDEAEEQHNTSFQQHAEDAADVCVAQQGTATAAEPVASSKQQEKAAAAARPKQVSPLDGSFYEFDQPSSDQDQQSLNADSDADYKVSNKRGKGKAGAAKTTADSKGSGHGGKATAAAAAGGAGSRKRKAAAAAYSAEKRQKQQKQAAPNDAASGSTNAEDTSQQSGLQLPGVGASGGRHDADQQADQQAEAAVQQAGAHDSMEGLQGDSDNWVQAAAVELKNALQGHTDGSAKAGEAAGRRAARTSKTKALHAMQQQLLDNQTQTLNLIPLLPHEHSDPIAPAFQEAAATTTAAAAIESVPAAALQLSGLHTATAADNAYANAATLLGAGSPPEQGGACVKGKGFKGFKLQNLGLDGLAEANEGDGGPLSEGGISAGGSAGASPSADDSETAHLTRLAVQGLKAQMTGSATVLVNTGATGGLLRTAVGLAAADMTPETARVTTARVVKKLALTAAATGKKNHTAAAAVTSAATLTAVPSRGLQPLLPLRLGSTGTAASGHRASQCNMGRGLTMQGLGRLLGGDVAAAPAAGQAAAGATSRGRRRGANAGGKKGAAATELLGDLAGGTDRTDDQAWGRFRLDDAAAGAGGLCEQGLAAAAVTEGLSSQRDITMVAQLISNALRDNDEEGNDEGSDDTDEIELLQAALVRALTNKRAASKHKQEAIIKEVETTVAAKLAELGSGLQQELSQLAATSRSCMSNLVQGLQDKAATITAMKERFDAHLNAAWQEYGEMYGQLSAVQQELQLHIEKKQRSYKRKLAQVQQEAAGMLAEAERKVDRKRSTVEARLPSLAAMLQTLA